MACPRATNPLPSQEPKIRVLQKTRTGYNQSPSLRKDGPMSVMKPDGRPAELPREHPLFWTAIETEFALEDQLRWKGVAMLTLHECCGWTMSMLGHAFGHPKGHCSRIVKKTKREMAERFKPPEGDQDRQAA